MSRTAVTEGDRAPGPTNATTATAGLAEAKVEPATIASEAAVKLQIGGADESIILRHPLAGSYGLYVFCIFGGGPGFDNCYGLCMFETSRHTGT